MARAGDSATAARRPSQQRADARIGAPRQLLSRETGVAPCAPARRLYEEGRVVNGVGAAGAGAFRAVGGGERRSSLSMKKGGLSMALVLRVLVPFGLWVVAS